jgi:hypothetical protein
MSETLLNGTPENNSGVDQNNVITGGGAGGGGAQGGNPAPFDFKSMLGDAGEFSENWRDGLPEGIRSEKCLDNIKNIGALANSYVHAQRAIGANKVALPNENSSDEDWAAFYKACGRPETETGYTTDGIQLPEGVTLDQSAVDSFRKFAFEHGFNQKTFNAALAYDVERVQQQAAAQAAAQQAEYNDTLAKLKTEETNGDLRKQYGNDFATVNAVIQQCNKAMNTFGLTEALGKAGLLNNYDVIKALAKIGASMSESRMKGGEDGIKHLPDPQSRLNEIRNNPDDPFYKKEHPAHEARVQEVNNLLAAIVNANTSK